MSRLLRSRAALRNSFLATTSLSVAYLYYAQSKSSSSKLLLEQPAPSPSASTAGSHPILWTPPTRKQMIDALKQGKAMPREKSDVATALFEGVQDDAVPEEQTKGGYDLLIIGGGATGSGVALDAASRGLKVAMVDRDDWSSGTSSKSTKLVHGGVRYLQKAIMELDYEQWKLVKEALHERKTFLHIAPHLSHSLPIMLPVYTWWKLPYFWAGTKMYDILAGKENMESSYIMSKGKALEQFPMLKSDKLVGALVYYDGQHNDSRMNLSIVMTAVHHGAVVANHVEAVKILKSVDPATGKERCSGATLRDKITGETWDVKARGVINATGPFTDGVRKLDDEQTKEIVAPSSGAHIILPRYYGPQKMGLLDPATADGRVLFLLPWQGQVLAGTTDQESPVDQHPLPQEAEIQWILGEVKNYLNADIKVRRGDILSAWSGIRPLVRNPNAKKTEGLVRNHMINISDTGLLTIAGGKWTTYRAMAQETVDAAIKEYGLKAGPCVTEKLRLLGAHGWHKNMFVSLVQQFGLDDDVAKHLAENYGSEAWQVCSMAERTGMRWPVHGKRLDASYPYIEAEVRYGVRREQAMTATDVIARRTRLSFLNAQAALEALPRVIDIMAEELGWNKKKCNQEFETARDFLRSMGLPPALQSLTLQQVRAGESQTTAENNPYTSRAVFSAEEIERLTATFANIDTDKDGKIAPSDLGKAIQEAGYKDASPDTIKALADSVNADRDGKVELPEFLAAVTGFKEMQLANEFGHRANTVTEAELRGEGRDEGQVNKQGRIPVVRSGGGT